MKLNFLGTTNSNQETILAIRKVFSDYFGLSEEQIETILNSAPATLIESDDEVELQTIQNLLKSSGAKVEIQYDSLALSSPSIKNQEELSFEFDEDDSLTEVEEDPKNSSPSINQEDNISFDFDLNDSAVEETIVEKKLEVTTPKEIQIDFSLDDEETELSQTASYIPTPPSEKKSEEINFVFETEGQSPPPLASVAVQPLISGSIVAPEEIPIRSEAMKLDYEANPKDKDYLENLKKQKEQAEKSKINIKTERIELNGGPIAKEGEFLEKGFDNKLYNAAGSSSSYQKTRTPLIKKEAWQYIIPILIGSSIVLTGTLLMLPTSNLTQEPQQTNIIATKNATEENKLPISSKYYGKSEEQEVAVEGNVTRYENELKNISLSITPPPPIALSAEDLVLNKKLPPWVEKLTIEPFKLQPAEENNSFVGSTKARLFVNYDDGKYRLITPVAVRALLDQEKNIVKVAMVIKSGFKDTPEKAYQVEINPNGNHRIYIKSLFEAKAVTE